MARIRIWIWVWWIWQILMGRVRFCWMGRCPMRRPLLEGRRIPILVLRWELEAWEVFGLWWCWLWEWFSCFEDLEAPGVSVYSAWNHVRDHHNAGDPAVSVWVSPSPGDTADIVLATQLIQLVLGQEPLLLVKRCLWRCLYLYISLLVLSPWRTDMDRLLFV
jgi:hypothetical protein